jgi:signal transduction histidine kinase
LRLEWRFVTARWIGIAFMAAVLPAIGLEPTRLSLAETVLVGAAVYNSVVHLLVLRSHPLLATGYLTTAADTALNLAMVLALGAGFDSPLSSFLVAVNVAVAMRYGYALAMGAGLVYVGVDFGEHVISGHPLDMPFAFRAGFLFLTVVLASYVREQADRDEQALRERLDELQHAYADLATAHQELLGLDALKTSFLANVSHELRTPLTSIRSFSEMLIAYEDDREVQREFATIINTESERLTRLINDVLDVARIEAGQMDWSMQVLDLRPLLEGRARAHAAAISARQLGFVEEFEQDLPMIFGDPDRLQQVLSNLLDNATKFTRAGTITFRAGREHNKVRVSVSDTGVGIANEHQELIFEKFQQVGNTLTDKPKGTGLGLAICREIVEHHGGRLWVESSLGEGSTFFVELPIAAGQTVYLDAEQARAA